MGQIIIQTVDLGLDSLPVFQSFLDIIVDVFESSTFGVSRICEHCFPVWVVERHFLANSSHKEISSLEF